ncbi:alpha/beta hydrolase [Shimia sp. NS0008-38b]|uniref:alpha/beta fold hydrolase n=1 Tax=Shimia sp. NS0008-38b TaxID=3127653 RepID=UPI00310B267A
MMSTTQQLSRAFGTTTYREAGRSHICATTPVVLVHGVGMQSASWDPQVQALSRQRHVIALDMPGHGGSDPLPETARLPEYIDWLRDVLEALGLERVNIAGHSMGALISGGFAVCHPHRVERVALLNGVFRRDAAAREAVITRAQRIGTGDFDLETPLKRWFGDTQSERKARDRVATWLSDVNLAGYATAYTAFAHGDATFADGYAQLRCPFLALTGADDPNSTPAMAHAMAQAAQHGRAVIIEGHRHMVNLTAPEIVNAALEEWLQTPIEEIDVA